MRSDVKSPYDISECTVDGTDGAIIGGVGYADKDDDDDDDDEEDSEDDESSFVVSSLE
jgi:hypothetical protein